MNPSQLIDMVLDMNKKMEAMQIRIQTLETQNMLLINANVEPILQTTVLEVMQMQIQTLENQNDELMAQTKIWEVNVKIGNTISSILSYTDIMNDMKLVDDYRSSIVFTANTSSYHYSTFIFSLNCYITINNYKLINLDIIGTMASLTFRKKKNYEEVYYLCAYYNFNIMDKYKSKITNIIKIKKPYGTSDTTIYELMGSLEDHKQYYIDLARL